MPNSTLLALAVAASGYVLVLNDGSGIELREPPRIEGQLVVGLLADGTAVSVLEKRVDHSASEVYNRPESQVKREAAAQPKPAPRARAPRKRAAMIDNRTIKEFAEATATTVPTTGEISAVSTVGEYAGPEVTTSSPPSLDRYGRGPDHWRQRAMAVRDEITFAERALASARRSLAAEEKGLLYGRTVSSGGLTVTQHGMTSEELGAMQFRISQLREKVADAEAILDVARDHEADLREDARQSGALPGWLRVP